MPVPISGLKVGSDTEKVKFVTIFGRPKTGVFRRFRSVPGGPKALDMDTLTARITRPLPGKPDLPGSTKPAPNHTRTLPDPYHTRTGALPEIGRNRMSDHLGI